MEGLASYESDDETGDKSRDAKESQNSSMLKTDMKGSFLRHSSEEDVNYDDVKMDMSEDSCSSGEEEKLSKSSKSSLSTKSHESSDNESSSDSADEKVRRKEKEKVVKRIPEKEKVRSRSKSPRDHIVKVREIREEKHKSSKRNGNSSKESRRRLEEQSKRSRSKDRERGKERKRSRSRERRRRSRSHSPERRRRSSPVRVRNKRSRSRERRSRSHDRRSRSPHDRRSRTHEKSPSRDRRSRSRDRHRRSRSRDRKDRKAGKLKVLEKLGIGLKPESLAPIMTPQQLLQKSMEAQIEKVKNVTGIELPKYYNPAAMNPVKYAEQMQKRKLLWGHKDSKETPTTTNKWEGTTFAQDQDGKLTAKFKRLMGIKTGEGPGTSTVVIQQPESGPSSPPPNSEILKKQEELFTSMEKQYEVARVATHTQRGVGLGFGSFQYPR